MIEKKDKPALFQLIQKLVYSETQSRFWQGAWENVKQSHLLEISTLFQTYEQKILPRKDEWSLMFRIQSQLPTNNVKVSQVRWYSELKKDLRFNWNRAFNQLELLKNDCDDSSYYSHRCIDVASSTLTSRLVNQNSRFLNWKTVAIDSDKKATSEM